MKRLMQGFAIGLSCFVLSGCAGFRGGWDSVAYIGDTPPSATESGGEAPALRVPGATLRVTIDNRLRTHDTQIVVLPLSVDPRSVFVKNVEPGKTRVFVTLTPESAGFVFRPALAALRIGDRQYSALRGNEFGMWDEQWRQIDKGGKWEHRDVGAEFRVTRAGAANHLSLDFAVPTPSPELRDITLDLSQALRHPAHSPLPLIRFAPVRWSNSYS